MCYNALYSHNNNANQAMWFKSMLTWAQGGVPEDNLLKQLYWCVLLFSIGVVLTRIDVLVRLYRCVLMCPPEFIDTITQARG